MPPATSPPEPAPIVEPTSTPFTPEAEQPASAGGGDSWIPNVDDRWAYNLDTPVDVEAKADVFFIDLGESMLTIVVVVDINFFRERREGIRPDTKYMYMCVSTKTQRSSTETAHLN